MSAIPYPLQWPEQIGRSRRRENGSFRTNFDNAVRNVQKSLRSFSNVTNKKITDAVISSNIDLMNSKPSDPGIAVWFVWDNESICIPVDRYATPAANLQAIHHILEARITEARHGTLQLVKATFKGFAALPPPPGAKAKRPWWVVLDIPSNRRVHKPEIEDTYRRLAKQCHPDAGGSDEKMAELNIARTEALAEC